VWRAAQARAHVAATQAAQQPMLWGRRGSCIEDTTAATTASTTKTTANTVNAAGTVAASATAAAAAALLDSTEATSATTVTNSSTTASVQGGSMLAVVPPSIAMLGAPGGSEQSPTGGAGSLHKLFSIELHQLQVQLHDDEVWLATHHCYINTCSMP
jgi:hypothetical protein